jgi:hypothetical protein
MSVETIYMPLLDEGTDVWAPVQAEPLERDSFRILGPKPDDQEWTFAPGAIVDTGAKTFSDGEPGIVALSISN